MPATPTFTVAGPYVATAFLLGFGEPWNPSSWVNITEYVNPTETKVATVAGRQHELTTIVPSSAKITLNNRDARFVPWNTAGPYAGIGNGLVPEQPIQIMAWLPGMNILTPVDSSFETGVGSFVPLLNVLSGHGFPEQFIDGLFGTYSLLWGAAAAGYSSVESGLYPAVPGVIYTAASYFMGDGGAYPATVGLAWYDSTSSLISTSTGTAITAPSSPTWSSTPASVQATAPANAAYYRIVLAYDDPTGGEAVFADGVAVYVGTLPASWTLGTYETLESPASYGYGGFPIFYGYVNSWIPEWTGQTALQADLTVSATDALGMLNVDDMSSSGYEALIAANTPQTYYTMTDLAGSTSAADSSGNNQTAIVQGTGATFGSSSMLACDIGTSLVLAVDSTDNSDTLLVMPTTVFGANPSVLTIAFWISTVEAATGFDIFTASYIPSSGIDAGLLTDWISFAIGATGIFVVGGGISGSSFTGPASTTAVNDGKNHLIVVRYAVTSAGTTSIEVDGVVEDSVTGSTSWIGANPGVTSVYLSSSGGTFAISQMAIFESTISEPTSVELYQLGTEGFVVQYSGQRIATALANATFPSAMTDIATGQSQLQPATSSLVGTSVLSYMQTAATSEQGYLFQSPSGIITFYDRHYPITSSYGSVSQATFEDAPSSNYFYVLPSFTPGLDDLDLWNQILGSAQPGPTFGNVQIPSGAPQQAQNIANQAQYGKRTYSVSGLLVRTDTEALEVAQWYLALYQNPTPRIRAIQMDAQTANGANLLQMLGRQLFDRVTVKFHGLVGGTALTQDSVIEGIEHTFDGMSWQTIFRLSPAEVQPWFVLDSATAGVLDTNILAY